VHCALAEAYQRLPAGTGVPEPRRSRAEKHCKDLRAQ
jgi:hypothetical protein